VEWNNDAAVKLYHSAGFVIVGHQRMMRLREVVAVDPVMGSNALHNHTRLVGGNEKGICREQIR